MNPLPLIVRRIVAFIFFVLFAIILLVVSIYASGYRLGEEFTLERTGGVHISIPISGGKLYIDGEEAGTSSFLDKSFFLDNLPSGTYAVTVEKEAYRTWEKRLIVERAFVTNTVAFLVPEAITVLPVIIGDDTNATTAREVSRADFFELNALFDVATTTATSTEKVSAPDPTELLVRNGNVYVKWNRNLERAPSAFCIAPQACVIEISVELDAEMVTRAEFFQNGVVYQAENGIYLSEIDVKQPRIVVPIYDVPGATFRIHTNGEMFIRDGDTLLVVEAL